MKKSYETPRVNILGSISELTQNVNQPQFVDVPEGTPVNPGPIVGDEEFVPS